MRLLWLLLALVFSAPCWAQGITEYPIAPLYKNAWMPLEGNIAANWRPYSHAYTAASEYVPFDLLKLGGAMPVRARLMVVWQARSPSAYTGIGLFACPALADAGNTDVSVACLTLAFFAGNDSEFASYTPGCAGSGAGPHPCEMDLKPGLGTLIAAGVPYYLTIGTFGNGYNGVYVYDMHVSVSWR